MKNKDLRLGIITATIYFVGIASVLSIIAWIGSALQTGGFYRYLNAEYAVGIIIGLAVSFICGYFYYPLLSQSIAQYSHRNPDIPMNYVERTCKSKLLLKYFGYTAATCLGAATLMFAFTKETYIEALCLLMSTGFTSGLLWLHYRNRSREIMRDYFRSIPI